MSLKGYVYTVELL